MKKYGCLFVIIAIIGLSSRCQASIPHSTDLHDFLPEGLNHLECELLDSPRVYKGEDLFMMINGGADIYHEYGFKQALQVDYIYGDNHSIRLELYQMATSSAAYGVYSHKISGSGEDVSLGQEARLDEYFINFWKNDIIITLIGQDSDDKTRQGLITLAKAVDRKITSTGNRPELVTLFRNEPLVLENMVYIKGLLGLLSSYVFDTKDIFNIEEGVTGSTADNQVFVFKYSSSDSQFKAFEKAMSNLDTNQRFSNQVRQDSAYWMVSRDNEIIRIAPIDRYLTIITGKNQTRIKEVFNQLINQLKD